MMVFRKNLKLINYFMLMHNSILEKYLILFIVMTIMKEREKKKRRRILNLNFFLRKYVAYISGFDICYVLIYF